MQPVPFYQLAFDFDDYTIVRTDQEEQESIFECPDCKQSDTATKWNETTALRYAVDICPIDSGMMFEYVYICPHCHEMNQGEEIPLLTS